MRALLAAIVVLAACDAYDKDLGPQPFFCGEDEPACPMDYSCVDDPANGTKVCVRDGDSISGNFDCDDDSDSEPNDMLTEAVMTGADSVKSYAIDGRAICPAGDRDVYGVMINTSNESIELTIVFQGGGAELAGGILNTGGVTIAAASDAAEAHTIRATARNLPTGQYYVHVFTPPGGGSLSVNNYELSLSVTGP